MFPCPHCPDKIYSNYDSLYKHKKRHHAKTSEKPSSSKRFECATCDYAGDTEAALQKHKERNHREIIRDSTEKARNSCFLCEEQLPNFKEYAKHHHDAHGNEKVIVEERWYENMEELGKWKNTVRAKYCVDFVTHYSWTTADSKAKLCICSRSGISRRTGGGKRAPKQSIKARKDCTAFLTIHMFNNGRIKTEFCLEHVGHEVEMSRLRLSADERAIIAKLLEDGHDTAWVVEKLRDMNPSGRLFYVTAQAVDYIKSCLNLDSGRLHSEDMASVLEAIRRDQEVCSDNGEDLEGHWQDFFAYSPANDSSGAGFQLGLQTAEQAAWLKEFGQNGICLDGTHHTTRYNLKMITMMVIDARQKGRPVAFFFSKEESEADLVAFFNGVKERCDFELKPAVIMTDAIQYWNAWGRVFGNERTQKLLCSWHLLKNWGERARDTIGDSDIRKRILTSLHKLVRLPVELSFRQHLSELLTMMDAVGCTDFREYFFNNYVKKEERLLSWAPFSRRKTIVNTNMALERFHGFCRNLARDALVQEKVKTRHRQYRLAQTHRSHRKAVASYGQAQFEDIQLTDEEGVYRVKSLTQQDLFHYVKRVKYCECQYEARCGYFDCQVCWHEMDCDCYASCKAGISCVHVHAVQLFLGPREWTVAEASESIVSESVTNDGEATKHRRNSSSSFSDWTRKTHSQLQTVEHLLHSIAPSVSSETQSEVTSKLDEIIDLLRCCQESVSISPRNQLNGRPASALPQRIEKRSAILKRKRQADRRVDDLNTVDHGVSNESLSYCAECFVGENGSDWVSCDKCQLWQHRDCAGFDETVVLEEIDFVCRLCESI